MSKKVHTSKADFKHFKATCLYYFELFGITEYEIEFKHEISKKGELAAAEWFTDRTAAKCITIFLGIDWSGIEITPKEIENTALHETLHILLSRSNNLACERFCHQQDIDEETHIIINRIMRAFSIR